MINVLLQKEVKTDFNGYCHLIEVYETIKCSEEKEATLNFGLCEKFDANLSAVLGSLLDDLKDRGYIIWLAHPHVEKIRDNLSRNKFFTAFNPEYVSDDPENFIEYRKFSFEETDEYKEYIQTQLMQKQKFPVHTEKAGKRIQESIWEIFVNAVTHGKCSYVYSCGEYDDSKNPPCLDMTVVDRGHTIPNRVNDYLTLRGWQQINSCEAISWALINGNTTKDTPGGLGFTVILEFLKLNHGAIQIISGKGMVEIRNGKQYNHILPKPFQGTIVNMEFNFNDNKNYMLASESVDMTDLL